MKKVRELLDEAEEDDKLMTFSSCLTNQDKAIVLDASVIINLLATAHAGAIFQALRADLIS